MVFILTRHQLACLANSANYVAATIRPAERDCKHSRTSHAVHPCLPVYFRRRAQGAGGQPVTVGARTCLTDEKRARVLFHSLFPKSRVTLAVRSFSCEFLFSRLFFGAEFGATSPFSPRVSLASALRAAAELWFPRRFVRDAHSSPGAVRTPAARLPPGGRVSLSPRRAMRYCKSIRAHPTRGAAIALLRGRLVRSSANSRRGVRF